MPAVLLALVAGRLFLRQATPPYNPPGLLWQAPVSKNTSSIIPGPDGNVLLVDATSGYLCMYGPDGKRRWKLRPEGVHGSMFRPWFRYYDIGFLADGTLVVLQMGDFRVGAAANTVPPEPPIRLISADGEELNRLDPGQGYNYVSGMDLIGNVVLTDARGSSGSTAQCVTSAWDSSGKLSFGFQRTQFSGRQRVPGPEGGILQYEAFNPVTRLDDDKLVLLDVMGNLRWERLLDPDRYYHVRSAGQFIWLSDDGGMLECIDPAGNPLWSLDCREEPISYKPAKEAPPSVLQFRDDGTVLLTGYSGKLQLLDGRGDILASIPHPGVSAQEIWLDADRQLVLMRRDDRIGFFDYTGAQSGMLMLPDAECAVVCDPLHGRFYVWSGRRLYCVGY